MRLTRLALGVLLLVTLVGLAVAAPNLPEVRLPGRNYVNNGGFERGADGWRYFSAAYGGVVTDEHHSGQACFKATGIGEDYRYFQQDGVSLLPGKTYTLSAWMKCAGFKRAGDNTTFLNLVNWGWTKSAMIGPATPDEGWRRYSVTFAAPPTKSIAEQPRYNLVIRARRSAVSRREGPPPWLPTPQRIMIAGSSPWPPRMSSTLRRASPRPEP